MDDGLVPLRAEIASIDAEIIRLVAERTDIAERIGKVKRMSGLDIRDPAIEATVIDRYVRSAGEYGIGADTARTVAEALILEAVRRQEMQP